MSAVREAPAHPLALGAAALVVVNDFVLREAVPGWLSGKLSDVGWLVVVPVLLASLLARVGIGDRVATRAALIVTAAFYTALQLWPPLGQFLRPGHVADAGDLLVLPALGLAVLCWRGKARGGAWAIPLLGATLIADSWAVPPDATAPCNLQPSWPPGEPLRVTLFPGGTYPYTSEAFLAGFRLLDAEGQALPVVVVPDEGDGMFELLVCARDGLQGDSSYTLHLGPWAGTESNQLNFEHPESIELNFTTEAGDGAPAATREACAALATLERTEQMEACLLASRGITADTGDTADSGDSE